VAVLVSVQGQDRVLFGTAAFTRDRRLGKVLRIAIDDQETSGALAMLIAEDKWQGEVLPDPVHGRDFLIKIAH
jgi:hypothetical protein